MFVSSLRCCSSPSLLVLVVGQRLRRSGFVDSIFLNVHPEVLQWEGVLFTPDVSNKRGVQAYPIRDAAEMIDYEVLYTRTDWKDANIRQRLLQAEKCEVLVPRSIPLEMIRNFPHG